MNQYDVGDCIAEPQERVVSRMQPNFHTTGLVMAMEGCR